jgi:hypothetical protein
MFQQDVFHAYGHAHTLYALCSTWVFTHNNDNDFRQNLADVRAQRPRNHMKAYTAMTNDARSHLSLVCYHISGYSLSFSTWLCFSTRTISRCTTICFLMVMISTVYKSRNPSGSIFLFNIQLQDFRYQISFPSQCDPTIMIQRNTVYASQDCISGALQKHLFYGANYYSIKK